MPTSQPTTSPTSGPTQSPTGDFDECDLNESLDDIIQCLRDRVEELDVKLVTKRQELQQFDDLEEYCSQTFDDITNIAQCQ